MVAALKGGNSRLPYALEIDTVKSIKPAVGRDYPDKPIAALRKRFDSPRGRTLAPSPARVVELFEREVRVENVSSASQGVPARTLDAAPWHAMMLRIVTGDELERCRCPRRSPIPSATFLPRLL